VTIDSTRHPSYHEPPRLTIHVISYICRCLLPTKFLDSVVVSGITLSNNALIRFRINSSNSELLHANGSPRSLPVPFHRPLSRCSRLSGLHSSPSISLSSLFPQFHRIRVSSLYFFGLSNHACGHLQNL
jgi:hypothetical protein